MLFFILLVLSLFKEWVSFKEFEGAWGLVFVSMIELCLEAIALAALLSP